MKDIKRHKQNTFAIMMIIGSLFFVFGFATWINSVLIPYFKLICELTVLHAMLVAFAFYISYFLMAFPSSIILKKTGYQNGMMLGLLTMAAGTLLFIPAANTREYSIFLIALFVEATGLTLLQTAANPYVTIIGPIESAASRISIMGICNKVGGAIAPLLLVNAVVKNPNEIDEVQKKLLTASVSEQTEILNALSSRLVLPYLIISLVLIGFALIIRFTRFPDIDDTSNRNASCNKSGRLFAHRQLILGAIALFCAVGVEVLAVDSIINYAQYTGLSFREAKYFATYTLLIMISSYAIGIFTIPKILSGKQALTVSAITGIVFTILALLIKGSASVWCIALLGLGNALLWPSIWPLALNGLGALTSKGSALLVMGVVGGAVVPLLYGVINHMLGEQTAYIILLPFYAFICYFALSSATSQRQPEKNPVASFEE